MGELPGAGRGAGHTVAKRLEDAASVPGCPAAT